MPIKVKGCKELPSETQFERAKVLRYGKKYYVPLMDYERAFDKLMDILQKIDLDNRNS